VSSLTLVVAIGLAVLLCTSVARRAGLAPPMLFLIAGLLLGFVPHLRVVHLPPETVLLLFLPILLYWESFSSSRREIRSNLRVIVLLSTVLVALTAAGVALGAHALGVPWGPAWVLGAAVAPTDATAVGVLGGILPRRLRTTLQAESLVNDGTALVIYALAIGVTIDHEQVSLGRLGGMFLLSYAGGVAVGVAVTWVSVQIRRRLTDPFQHNLLAVLTPLTAYLIAEAIGASGVLSVVVSGLWVGRVSPHLFPAVARQYVKTVMGFLTGLANAALFVLVGLETQSAVRGLDSVGLSRGILIALGTCAMIVAVRFGWMFTSPYLIRLLDRRPVQRARRLSSRPRTVIAAAGFRGAVSLAAALAVPDRFPDRDLVVFATAAVIAFTLLVQAPLLPRVVRWARLGRDDQPAEERRQAEITAVEQALKSLPELAEQHDVDEEIAGQLRAEYERRLAVLREGATDWDKSEWEQKLADLRLAVIAHKNDTILRLRREGRIDDEVVREIQDNLDLEQLRLQS
jgi:monovalent cation:H+ antiporter, CPA1 family